jgi:hypothetical protein
VIAAAVLSVAAGVILGWVAASVITTSRRERRQQSESMRRYADLVRVLGRTSTPRGKS